MSSGRSLCLFSIESIRTNHRTLVNLFYLCYIYFMAAIKLSPLQDKLLKLLSRHLDEPLSYRELAREIGVVSTNTVSYHLNQLERLGHLKRDPADPRHYQVLGAPETGVAYLNLYGLARCGPRGSVLDGSPIDRIPVSTRLIPFPAVDAFLVKAKGDSMEGRIYDGDLVLAKRQPAAENGDLVVCVNKGEALIKKFKKDFDARGVILISLNPKYEPFFAAREDFRIEGVVKAIISRAVNFRIEHAQHGLAVGPPVAALAALGRPVNLGNVSGERVSGALTREGGIVNHFDFRKPAVHDSAILKAQPDFRNARGQVLDTGAA